MMLPPPHLLKSIRTDNVYRESPCGVVANVLDYDIVVNNVELQLPYYIHFRINTLRKGLNTLIPLAMG